MPILSNNAVCSPPAAERDAVKNVLIVDDSKAQRRILSSYLGRWGYDVFEAKSGIDALELCENEDIDLVVSDWLMPEMDGLEFCQAFRSLEREHYGYFILLTSKTEKAAAAEGLNVGADDFLNKPVAGDELLARIRAGDRIMRMERELTRKNQLVSKTLAQISELYDSLDSDLIEARKLQQSLVRDRFYDFETAQVSLLLHPSGHVGGDLVGIFPISTGKFGVFALDVAGHGIASALMTARLAAYLTGSAPNQNIAIKHSPDGCVVPVDPAAVAKQLNSLMFEEMDTDLYFTMVLGYFDCFKGEFVMTQCGHPDLIVQRASGAISICGGGGLPIGLISNAEYDTKRLTLNSGDRLLICSDGITECTDPHSNMLGEKGFAAMLEKLRPIKGTELFDYLMKDLGDYSEGKDFSDDISAILLEYSDQISGE